MQFRDGVITFSQFFARVAARQGIAKYTVFDDLITELADGVRESLTAARDAARANPN